jgi:hypothetical protein
MRLSSPPMEHVPENLVPRSPLISRATFREGPPLSASVLSVSSSSFARASTSPARAAAPARHRVSGARDDAFSSPRPGVSGPGCRALTRVLPRSSDPPFPPRRSGRQRAVSRHRTARSHRNSPGQGARPASQPTQTPPSRSNPTHLVSKRILLGRTPAPREPSNSFHNKSAA